MSTVELCTTIGDFSGVLPGRSAPGGGPAGAAGRPGPRRDLPGHASTEAGRRAMRRRARAVARRRPPSGMVPSGAYRGGVRSFDGSRRPELLTTPGRWVRLAATVIVVTALGVAAVRVMAPSTVTHVEVVPVVSGDTLWSIARAAQPDTDPRQVIDEIRRLNGLTGSDITAGQSLAVPAAR